MPKVTVHHDFYPDDEVFSLPGLGGLTNHKAKEVDAAQVAEYELNGFKWPEDTDHLVLRYTEGVEPNPPVENVDAVLVLEPSDVEDDK